MLSYIFLSFNNSLVESLIFLFFGGISVIGSWFIVIQIGFFPQTLLFFVFIIIISILLEWISVFWVKILFFPSNRGKLSLFSPFTTKFLQITFKNDGFIPVISILWLSIWLFIVSIGISCSIRQNPVYFKNFNKIQPFHSCCKTIESNFSFWYQNEYLPFIFNEQKRSINERKFILFQPTSLNNLENLINGLFTSFSLSIITNRELLIDLPIDFLELFEFNQWEWNFNKIFPKFPLNYILLDLTTSPSFIVPPVHGWFWSDLLTKNLSNTILLNHQVVIVDCNEFLSPIFWSNPIYKQKLCSICNIDLIYSSFSNLFLKFNKNILELSNNIQNSFNYNDFLIGIFEGMNKRMKEIALRCLISQTKSKEILLLY